MKLLKSSASDLAALLSYRWVALPLMILATFKLYSLDPNTLLYSVFLILVTALFSVRLCMQFIVQQRVQFAREYQQQKKQKPD